MKIREKRKHTTKTWNFLRRNKDNGVFQFDKQSSLDFVNLNFFQKQSSYGTSGSNISMKT